MANAMQSTAKTMAKMNKVMNPAQMSKVTQQFTQEHTKLGIKEEMSMWEIHFEDENKRLVFFSVGETLDAAFGQEGDSDEEDAIVNQVLDEIGISLNEKVCFYFFD
jgi:division protein CdvB (Snf7/Vps24/ESCRT-III family)